MFKVLLESRALRQRRLGSTIASATAHGAIIAGAVALTLTGRGNAAPPPPVADSTITYVAVRSPAPAPMESRASHQPGSPTSPTPQANVHTIDFPTIVLSELPPIEIGPVLEPDQIRVGRGPRPGALVGSPEPFTTPGVGEALNATEVDRAPRVIGRAVEPRYPATLRAAGIEGQLTVEFVVDTLGRVELDGLRFSGATNPLFSASIRDALTRYRFMPGETAGRKVRTRVQIPFQFRLTR